MRKRASFLLIFVFIFASDVFAVMLTEIRYNANDVGSGRWEYTYEVKNISLELPIEEFTIWFDYGKYDNLVITTPDPPAGNWNQIVIQPEQLIGDDGFYDAYVLATGISEGEIVSGFSVSFDWLGQGLPGSQFYEIINPVTFETIDWGITVPEPATLTLFGFAMLFIFRRQGAGRE